MSKKITIKEEDIESPPEETHDEIIQQVAEAPPPPSPPPAAEPPTQQKAESKMRMRELYKCEGCGKYLTKKSLNYSHQNTCKGNPANQAKAPKEKPPPPQQQQEPVNIEYVEEATPVQLPEPPPMVPQMPLYQQMAMERRRAHLEKIDRLKRFIV